MTLERLNEIRATANYAEIVIPVYEGFTILDLAATTLRAQAQPSESVTSGLYGEFTPISINASPPQQAQPSEAVAVKPLEWLRAALRPFADAVFNDNGEMTVTHASFDAYVAAYFASRRVGE